VQLNAVIIDGGNHFTVLKKYSSRGEVSALVARSFSGGSA
jgi:hypothetical protein